MAAETAAFNSLAKPDFPAFKADARKAFAAVADRFLIGHASSTRRGGIRKARIAPIPSHEALIAVARFSTTRAAIGLGDWPLVATNAVVKITLQAAGADSVSLDLRESRL